MRLVIRAELQKEPLEIQAAADPSDRPAASWRLLNLKVKTIVSVLAIGSSLFGLYVTSRVQIAQGQERIEAISARLTEEEGTTARLNKRISEDTVTTKDFEHYVEQQNLVIGALTVGQQQLYNAMIQSRVAQAEEFHGLH